MEERTLELTIISAEDLKKVVTFGNETCYAVAYIHSSGKKTTQVDKNGGVNPRWNTKLTLTCDDKLLQRAGSYITVEIYHYGSFSSKLVGTSKISLVDIGKQAGSTQPQSMAFEVRRPSKKVKGVLNVSVKVGEKRTVNQKYHSAQDFSSPSAYQTYPPTSWSSQQPAVYRPPKAGNDSAVYPPPRDSSTPSVANTGGVYPPPKASSDPSATTRSDSKAEEPVLAYPVTGNPAAYPPQSYGQAYDPQYYVPQYYGPQYPGPQQYFYPPQGNAPSGYQNVQYSKPSRYRGSSSSSGAGLGLLGGVLGGLLVGDVIGGLIF